MNAEMVSAGREKIGVFRLGLGISWEDVQGLSVGSHGRLLILLVVRSLKTSCLVITRGEFLNCYTSR